MYKEGIYISITLYILLIGVKILDLFLPNKLKTKIQGYLESLTIIVDDIRPIEWYKSNYNKIGYLNYALLSAVLFSVLGVLNMALNVTEQDREVRISIMQISLVGAYFPYLYFFRRFMLKIYPDFRPLTPKEINNYKLFSYLWLVLAISYVGDIILLDKLFGVSFQDLLAGKGTMTMVGYLWLSMVVTVIGAYVVSVILLPFNILVISIIVRAFNMLVEALKLFLWRVAEYSLGSWSAIVLVVTILIFIVIVITQVNGIHVSQ